MEAFGLFLGVLPLLISAIEHYDDVLQPFTRYRNFTSKAQQLHDEIETERIIVRTECQLLLGAATSRDTALQMLHNPQHPSWDDQAFRRNFDLRLGSLGTTGAMLISKIESKLDEISRESQGFDTVVSETQRVGHR